MYIALWASPRDWRLDAGGCGALTVRVGHRICTCIVVHRHANSDQNLFFQRFDAFEIIRRGNVDFEVGGPVIACSDRVGCY